MNDLIEFFNKQERWADHYYNNNNDYIDGYDHILFEKMDLSKARYFLSEFQNKCINEDDLREILENTAIIERAGVFYDNHQLSFIPIYEEEIQLTGLSENGHACIYSDLTKNLTTQEIENAFELSDLSDSGVLRGEFVHWRPDFETIQLNVEEDELIEGVNDLLRERGEINEHD